LLYSYFIPLFVANDTAEILIIFQSWIIYLHFMMKNINKKSGMLVENLQPTVLDGKMLTGCPLYEFSPPIDYMQ